MNLAPKVDVVMVTYNQAGYIAQAIESVLIQKTDFPFRLIIGEDCSIDNTRNICLEYAKKFPDKITLILHDTNQGLAKNYKSVFDLCNAKYVAILEGDDYWIDDRKLQKQADLLDSDSDVGLVHAGICELYQEYNRILPQKKATIERCYRNQGCVFEELVKNNFISALTVLMRRNILIEKINFQYFLGNDYKTIDYPLWLGFACCSKVAYLKDIVGVYRILLNSISHNSTITSKMQFEETIHSALNYYISECPIPTISQQYLADKMNESLFIHSFLYGDFKSAEHFSRLVSKETITMKLRYLISKTRVLFWLFSFFERFNYLIKLKCKLKFGQKSIG